jgi:hypothetical protein
MPRTTNKSTTNVSALGLPLGRLFSNTLPAGGIMSLKLAKTASHIASFGRSNLPVLAGVGAVLFVQIAAAQENLLREQETSLTARWILNGLPPTEATKDSRNVANESTFLTPASNDPAERFASIDDVKSSQQSMAKDRGPIVLPALTVPNISVSDIGSEKAKGSTPEDAVAGRLPNIIPLPFGPDRFGQWSLEYKTWTAPVFCHQPTYFEDTMLEQHGHERVPALQPILSGVRFYSAAVFLPYLSYVNPPLKYSYQGDHYRPGSCAPALRQRPPYDKGALRFQLLTTGTAVLTMQP